MNTVLIPGKKKEPKQKGLKADLHTHTCDGFMEKSINYNAFQLIDAAMEKGLDVLSITNHDDFTYSEYLKDYACERGILLIPGIELTIKQKHVLAYPLSGSVEDIHDLCDLEQRMDKDLLLVAPHPFYPIGRSLGEKFTAWRHIFDAVELCHFYTASINFNKKAVEAAKKYNLPLLGTSDSHSFQQLGTTYSFIYAEKDPEAVFEAIRNGFVDVVTAPLSMLDIGMLFHELVIQNSMKKISAACISLFSFLNKS